MSLYKKSRFSVRKFIENEPVEPRCLNIIDELDEREMFSVPSIFNVSWHSAEKPSLTSKDKVVSFVRRSSRKQKLSLDEQEDLLRSEIQLVGAEWLHTIRTTEKGNEAIFYELPNAFRLARKLGATVLLFFTMNRLARPISFDSISNRNPDYTVWELRKIERMARSIRIVSLTDPDLPNSKQSSFQIKNAQRFTGNRGGRPPKQISDEKVAGAKKAVREENAPLVTMYREQGYTDTEIAKLLGIARSTIWGWN